VHRPFDRARDDPSLAGIRGGVIDDAMAQERPVLHQAKHCSPPIGARSYRVIARIRIAY
jgi:hypothetical protein